MTDDHLDKETSLSVTLTENGIKAGAKSRTIAALDRFCGSLFDLGSAHVESSTDKRRAKTAGEVRIINEASAIAAKKLEIEEPFAQRAIEKHFNKVLDQQINSDRVVKLALEDLRSNPPTQEQSEDDKPLSEDFLNRFDSYARNASSDQIRERWGRVLAGEIREPGTFSAKVLRIVDEIDSDVAKLFEDLCNNRFNNIILYALTNDIKYPEKVSLIQSGLIIDPGISTQYIKFVKLKDMSNTEMHYCGVSRIGGIAFPTLDENDSEITIKKIEKIIISTDKEIGIPGHLLTDAGLALASILPDKQMNTLKEYAFILKDSLKLPWVRLYGPDKDGEQVVIETIGSN